MLLKLATRNIRRSIRDYAIYFITLLFGVAVFYAFNSIGSQQILFDMESSTTERMMYTTQIFMQLFSGVVAAVLGFLIIYANQLLIRRRKHEFGIYLTLGMNPGSISRIVLYETVLVGIISLVVGLICGVLLSQGLSFVTAALFETTITTYQFVFSPDALVMTLVCFAIIYIIVSIFNVFVVNRYKLIDLLSANAKNEKAIRNPWVCLVAFVASIGILAVAYQQLLENGLQDIDAQFWLATMLMLVGTLIFFWSLAGFVIAILTHARGVYLRGLVPFTVRQIASKVNTAFISLWMVCVVLFFSITTFSVGMSMVEIFTSGINDANPYDQTLRANIEGDIDEAHSIDDALQMKARFAAKHPLAYSLGEESGWNIRTALEPLMPEWNDLVAASQQIDLWFVPGITYGELLSDSGATTGTQVQDDAIRASNIIIMSASQFNGSLALSGRDMVEIADDEMLVTNNFEPAESLAEDIAKRRAPLDVMGHELSVKDEVVAFQHEDSAMQSNALTLVVPDAVVDDLIQAGLIPNTSILNINFVNPSNETDLAFSHALAKALPPDDGATIEIDGVDVSDTMFKSMLFPVTTALSKLEMVEQANGFRMMITYLALYIGFVFLISTAAILAIQQISVATDSQARYRLLSKLGCDSGMLNRSLFVQVLVYFLAPLALAICHTACAIAALSDTLYQALAFDITSSIGMCVIFTVVIYGGYMLVTYFASRSVVRQAVRAV